MSVLTSSRPGMLTGMEEVLVENADDVCLHEAYATALLSQGDDTCSARARFIQTQIKLEDPRLGDEERRKLVGRERKLLRDHGKKWLESLAEWLCGTEYHFTMRRGWLHSVTAPELDGDFIAALVRSPMARMLRELHIETPLPDRSAGLVALVGSSLLAGLKEFRLGAEGAGEDPTEVVRRLMSDREPKASATGPAITLTLID